MENGNEVESNLDNQIASGSQLVINDFGTWYCSKAYLPCLQAVILKLSRSVTQELVSNSVRPLPPLRGSRQLSGV